MKKHLITVLAGVLLIAAGAGGALWYIQSTRGTNPHGHGADPDFCAKHELPEAKCPWCDKSLIKKLGHCAEHDVAEAFCSRCNSALIPGFKAENDWCAGHAVPESQCAPCKAGNLPPGEKPKAKTKTGEAKK